MNEYALFGAGNQSLHMEKVIRRINPNLKALYMIENRAFDKIGIRLRLDESDDEVQVITLEHFRDLYRNGKCGFVAVPSGYHIFDLDYIRDSMRNLGIKDEDVRTLPVNFLRMPIDDIVVGDLQLEPLCDLVQICHLDIHVANHCNMNCEACSHFAPLAYDKWMVTANRFEDNIAMLQSKIENICSIAMLGGEPLLNPELNTLLDIIRKYYPYANIALVTNAILLESVSDKIIESIRNNRITVSISLYPPLFNKVEDYIAFLREKNLQFSITRIEKFERKLFSEPFVDGAEMTKKCGHIMCLRDRRIGRCAEALFTDYYNKAYGKCIPVDNGIDIFGTETGSEIVRRLNEPLELCNQCCARDHYYKKWSRMVEKGNPDDWMVPISIMRKESNND